MPGPGKPFAKGWQGGPGRPKGAYRNKLCSDFAEKEGFARLIEIAKGQARDTNGRLKNAGWAPVPGKDGKPTGRLVWIGPSAELQFEALKLALAYGVGKPTEFIDVSSGGDSLADWAFAWFGAHPNGHANGSNGSNGHGPNGASGNGHSGLYPVSGDDPK